MTHDRDGWPEPRLINGIYRVVGEPPPQPPYADLEQRVPDAWTDAVADEPRGSFRRGLLFGCGTELAALLLVLAIAFLLGHVAASVVPPSAPRPPETARVAPIAPVAASVTTTLSGVASWYAWHPGEAAAGPRLRSWLGPRWRGQRVTVSGPAGSRVVRLTDFMRADRLVDLASANFPSICGPLSMGLCRVSIAVGGRPVPTAPIPTAPATDLAP